MSENKTNKLLLNKVESEESNIQTNKTNAFLIKNDFVKYDIQTLIEKLNNLPTCLNSFLESLMNDPNGLSKLLEIRRKNIKIKMYKLINYFVCQWCKENCLKYLIQEEKEINITETNSKICMCGIENHIYFIYEEKILLNPEDQNEIKKIIDIHNDISIEYDKKHKIIKEKILTLIKGKENERILQIISYILNVNFLENYFYHYSFNDEIFKIILSCIKENKDCSYFNNVMYFYFRNFIINNISIKNPPIFIFNDEFMSIDTVPALYYCKPDAFYFSFYFQVYRKRIVSKWLESHEVFSFLRKNGISNDVLCSHLLNTHPIPEIFSFGLLSLDLIFTNSKIKTSKFNIAISNNLIYIFVNQNCDIFADFMNHGKTNRICLIEGKNYFSKIFYDKILEQILGLFLSGKQRNFKIVKDILIRFPLFRMSLNDENKERILIALSSFAFLMEKEKKNLFNESDNFETIFASIENEVKKIFNENKKKNTIQNKIYSSQKNCSILII